MLKIKAEDLQIIDDREPFDIIFNSGRPSIAYTLTTDDITKGKKPDATPYASRRGEFYKRDSRWYNDETDASMEIRCDGNGLRMIVDCANENLSEWGLNLPFNFMGKKYGGGWKNQFLLNSPYICSDREYKSFYLTKPNGNHLLVVVLSDADGWKMDYSEVLFGSYFSNLKILANFDKAYGVFSRKKRLDVGIYPVENYEEALKMLAKLFSAPFLYADTNAGKIGKEIKLNFFGEYNRLYEIKEGVRTELPKSDTYIIRTEGEVSLQPYCHEKKGGEITVYGYRDEESLYKKSMESVDLSVIANSTDENLCEHQCWAAAMLRFLMKYGEKLNKEEVERFETKILTLLGRVTETDPNKAVARLTILDKPFENYPAYNIFRSRRIQEQFFGVMLCLDAYRYFKDEKYCRYAVGAMDSLLENYQKQDGRIETSNCEKFEDYTAVCSIMIPLADMSNFFADKDAVRAKRYADAADGVAEYLYRRGWTFNTEGGTTSALEPRVTDGAVACTMLTLLYYCKNIKRVDRYLKFAKELLDVHENWVIKTPICQMRGSSLRWWETKWEGDADGPAIDCGHAWTIWRAESDWLYYKLSGDERYLDRAINGFNTNFSKINRNGDSFAIYNVDDINGGGIHYYSDEIEFKIAEKFPKQKDCGLSRYVWSRAVDTIFTDERINNEK